MAKNLLLVLLAVTLTALGARIADSAETTDLAEILNSSTARISAETLSANSDLWYELATSNSQLLGHINFKVKDQWKNGERIFRVIANTRIAPAWEIRYASETRASDLVGLSFEERRLRAGQMVSKVAARLEGDSYSIVRLVDGRESESHVPVIKGVLSPDADTLAMMFMDLSTPGRYSFRQYAFEADGTRIKNVLMSVRGPMTLEIDGRRLRVAEVGLDSVAEPGALREKVEFYWSPHERYPVRYVITSSPNLPTRTRLVATLAKKSAVERKVSELVRQAGAAGARLERVSRAGKLSGNTYANSELKFELTGPSGWQFRSSPNGVGFVSPSTGATVNALWEMLPFSMSSEAYAALGIAYLKRQAQVVGEIDTRNITFAGGPAVELKYVAKFGPADVSIRQIILVRDKIGYTLTGGTAVGNKRPWPTINEAMDSFRFLDVKKADHR